jgi:hypothetical protein
VPKLSARAVEHSHSFITSTATIHRPSSRRRGHTACSCRLWVGHPGGCRCGTPGGRLLRDRTNQGCRFSGHHTFESAEGRHLLATVGYGPHHTRHPSDAQRAFLDVWDLGEAPPHTDALRPAHKQG